MVVGYVSFVGQHSNRNIVSIHRAYFKEMTAEEKKEQGLAYKRVISFALFGYGTTVESGFGFIDYLHGLLRCTTQYNDGIWIVF